MATYPSGLGNDQQAMQATAAMRQEPWYQSLLTSWGIDPKGDANGNVRLNDAQRAQVMAQAIQHGIGFNGKYDMVDENGQIAEEHHKLKKAAIAAAIAGLAVTGLGAAGIGPLAGALGGAGAAGAAAVPATEGIASATALGLPVTAGLGTAGAATTAASVLGAGGSTLGKISSIIGAAGKGIGDATTAAGQNDLNQEQLGLNAANIDISGQKAATDEALAVDKANTQKGQQHLRDQFMLEKAQHPSASPFDVTGGVHYSPEYLSALQKIAAADPTMLATPAPYKPITPSGAQAATGTTPSTLQKIGNIASPVTTVASKILPFFK